MWRLLLISPSLATRGVSPAEEQRYQSTTFICEGGTELPAAAVNDDFCDCGDDEPGTAACGGDRWFYCPNAGATPRYVYLSRVGDGICDCCDGSDEWQRGACPDVCAEQRRQRQTRQAQRLAEMQRGVELRKAALESRQAEVKEGEARIAALEREREPLATQLAHWERQQQERRSAARQEAQELGRDTSEFEEKEKVSEYAKWMEKGQESKEAVCSGTTCARKAMPRREVKQIRVWSGALIDFIEFSYHQGEPLRVGEGQGEEQEPFDVDGAIVEVRGGQGGALDRLQFVTSSGKVSKVYGGEGGENFTFQASEGKMITGLSRRPGLAGKIQEILESWQRPLTAAEEALDEATERLEETRRKLNAKESELAELRGKMDVGPNAYKALQRCGENQIGEYTYKICPFEEAKQGHVSLGRWKGWADEAHTGIFEGGERCFSGIVRSLRVHFECGADYVIETVKEPSQCVYEATMTHPAACDEKAFDTEERILAPHEGHLEL